MKLHDVVDETYRELAALHALDALPAHEARSFEAHLRDCATCRREVDSLRDAASGIGSLAVEEPPAGLRDRLLARVRAEAGRAAGRPDQTWKGWSADAGDASEILRRAAEAVWEPTGYHGVDTRKLFVDAAADRVTMLIRMKAGTSYPAHVHRGPEECLVLEGDLLSGRTPMKAGDYRRAPAGSLDGIQSTENGCVLLIVSSLRDEILATPPA